MPPSGGFIDADTEEAIPPLQSDEDPSSSSSSSSDNDSSVDSYSTDDVKELAAITNDDELMARIQS